MDDLPKFTKSTGSPVSKALKKVGKATSTQLTEMTKNQPNAVTATLKVLHNQSKIHIGDWETNSRGKLTAVWFWGDGDDKLESSIRHKDGFTPRPDVAAAWLFNV